MLIALPEKIPWPVRHLASVIVFNAFFDAFMIQTEIEQEGQR